MKVCSYIKQDRGALWSICGFFSPQKNRAPAIHKTQEAEQQRELMSKLPGLDKNLNDLSFLEERVTDPKHAIDTNEKEQMNT